MVTGKQLIAQTCAIVKGMARGIGYETAVVVRSKRTTPGIPTWSPTVVLTRPDDA